jgi:hypothetical protein
MTQSIKIESEDEICRFHSPSLDSFFLFSTCILRFFLTKMTSVYCVLPQGAKVPVVVEVGDGERIYF